jgi:hypothetical protein
MSILDNLYNALTRKVQTSNRDITREIIEDWVGYAADQARQIAFMSVVLDDLESGEYTPEEMVGDILQLSCLDS